jgi:hypothetical protein
VKKDTKAAEAFRVELSGKIADVAGVNPQKPVRIWVLDEHRYGLLPVIRRVWAKRGVRVHAPYKTNYKWGYLHEALEVDGKHSVEFDPTSKNREGLTKERDPKWKKHKADMRDATTANLRKTPGHSWRVARKSKRWPRICASLYLSGPHLYHLKLKVRLVIGGPTFSSIMIFFPVR